MECIAQASRLIFLENQYFTSHELCEALAKRLQEPNGPEIVLISTLQSPSWFDRMTMDTARAPLLERLQRADRNRRFRALGPRTTGRAPILVHSKVAIFDDEVVCVGSANLNNRAEAFDSELEVAVTATDISGRQGVRELRNELISHFLEMPSARLAALETETGSLTAALDLSPNARLTPLRASPTPLERVIASLRLGDPRNVEENWRLLGRRTLGR
ncbi:phospholipase D-like domain-containing protein [Phenylobacterium sp. J367]|uniref:phospholipase D-like domain-containing protein n=1 Tax=Phenylobacterium sp. J367 TaxID=2898435 RepID=UPI0021509EFF|nr:phospholipase D-like domain-containing protein [Phenylobacterium sp. J367]MCR5881254.1 phospholipase D-like domain-containing protein [Phenylobacterium sp. J367]